MNKIPKNSYPHGDNSLGRDEANSPEDRGLSEKEPMPLERFDKVRKDWEEGLGGSQGDED